MNGAKTDPCDKTNNPPIQIIINIIKNIVFIVGLNGKKKFISKAKKLSETKPIKEIKLKS